MDRCNKAHLSTLFHSKTGNLIWEEYSKSLDEARKRVNSELKYLDQYKDMFCGVLLLKNKSRKQRESKNFKLLYQLLSADLNSDVTDNVNVEFLQAF